MTLAQPTDAEPVTAATSAEEEPGEVEEILVEEVSIDGMRGVY